MLITALEKERAAIRQKGIEKGIEQGIEQGAVAMRQTIEQILRWRFRDAPTEINQQLQEIPLSELNGLVDISLETESTSEFLRYLKTLDPTE